MAATWPITGTQQPQVENMQELYDSIVDRYHYLGICGGTVAVTNGNKTCTGTTTKFEQEFEDDDWTEVDGNITQIDTVNSNTSITFKTNYTGTTGSGKTMYGNGGLCWNANPDDPSPDGTLRDLLVYRNAVEELAPYFVRDIAPDPIARLHSNRFTWATLATDAFGGADWDQTTVTRAPHIDDLNDMKDCLDLLIYPWAGWWSWKPINITKGTVAKANATSWAAVLAETATWFTGAGYSFVQSVANDYDIRRTHYLARNHNNKGRSLWVQDLTSGEMYHRMVQTKSSGEGSSYVAIQYNAGSADNTSDADNVFDSGYATLLFETTPAATDEAINTITAADIYCVGQFKNDITEDAGNWHLHTSSYNGVAMTAGHTWI